jgi:hypothetical protein
MKTTLVNITLEWLHAPAEGRFEFDHAEVIAGTPIIGWGAVSMEDYRVTYSSAGEMCRMCFALRTEGEENDITTVVRFTDNEHPFEFSIKNVLQQDQEELRLEELGVKIVAEIDYFAML